MVKLLESGIKHEMITELMTAGYYPSGYWVHASESGWKEVITGLVEQGEISIW